MAQLVGPARWPCATDLDRGEPILNDEFLRRQAADVGSDELPDYGFGGGPLFRDEVAPGAPGLRDGGGSGLDYGSGGDYGTGPASSGFGGPSGSHHATASGHDAQAQPYC